jgi:sialate O-acetylesterase
LAYIAEAKTYHLPVAFSGPIYESYTIEGNKIRIKFKYAENGLKTNDGKALAGFAIAGPDHKFQWATAVIEGNDIIVGSPDIEFPVAVRYGWANNPDCNLYNGANLPASPFRTDDWR